MPLVAIVPRWVGHVAADRHALR